MRPSGHQARAVLVAVLATFATQTTASAAPVDPPTARSSAVDRAPKKATKKASKKSTKSRTCVVRGVKSSKQRAILKQRPCRTVRALKALSAKPAVPTGLRVAYAGDGRVELDWNDNSGEYVRYQVYRDNKLIADGPVDSDFVDRTITNGRTYSYRVGAGAAPYYGDWTTAVSATPKAVTTRPAIPTGLKVVAVGDGRVQLDWADNTDNYGHYQVYRDNKMIADGPTASAYTDTGLTNGRTYTYRVGAGSNPVWGDWGTTVSATPGVAAPAPTPTPTPAPVQTPAPTPAPTTTVKPAIPTGLKVVKAADGAVELDWADNTDNFGRYQVYRDNVMIADGPTVSRYVDSGLSNGRTYSYRVSAGLPGNYGDWGVAVAATPVSSAPAPTTDPVPTTAPAPAPTSGTCNYVVSTTGSDSNAGTLAAPFRTPQKGMGVASAGQSVCMRGGVYQGTKFTITKSGTAGNPITLKSYPGERAIVDGGVNTATTVGSDWSGQIGIAASHVTVDGLEVRNAGGTGILASGDYDNIIVRNNIVHHVTRNGIQLSGDNHLVEGNEVYMTGMSNYNGRTLTEGGYWQGGISTGAKAPGVRSTNFTYRNNYVHEIWGEAMNALFLDGFHFHDNVVRDGWSVNIYLDNAADGLLERNYSYKTPGWNVSWTPKALAFGNEYYAQFPNPRPLENITLKNNIFANAAQVMIISQRTTNNYYRNVKFLGNTFYNNAISLTTPTPGGNAFRDNIMDGAFSVSNMSTGWTVSHNAFPRGNTVGANPVTGSPMFVNPSAGTTGGFKLQAGSPLKGKGIALADLSHDFGNAVRQSPPSVGAFE